jgi:hypothetical protein
MSTPPAENPVPGVVTFTARGNAALDQLAATLAAECDGSPTSIADLLEHVLEADIEELAEALNETTQPTPDNRPGHGFAEVGPAGESPDEAARRRLGAHVPGARGAPETRSFDIGR